MWINFVESHGDESRGYHDDFPVQQQADQDRVALSSLFLARVAPLIIN